MAKEKTEETEEKKKEGVTIKVPKTNFWMITTLVLVIVLVVVLVKGQGITGQVVASTLTAQEAADKGVDYINKYLLAGQATATLVSAKEENGLYVAKITISGKEYDTYITTDGKLLFPSVVDISKTPETETTDQQPVQEMKKTDKPVAQLYVMSFCPYGMQAEQIMKPVVDLFGTKVAIEPHFIVSVSGTTVSSLHGEYEANEDMRQACIWKNYGQTTFWTYIDYINKNCNKGNIDTCWKDAAKTAKVDTTKIENCVKTDGLTLMKAEDALSKQNGVSGSPTLIINGVRYSGARTVEGYKQAICSAFNKQPTECTKTLNETGGSAPSGGCAT